MALVRSDQKGIEEVQRIRAALAEGRPVLTEAQKDLIKQQTALLGEDGDAIMRVIQEDAKVAGRLPADISKVIEKCCQDLSPRVARLERSNEVQREREPQRLLQIEAIREQVTKYVAAKGKGINADLMRVKQGLPNLVAKYMKDLETDEKDGLSSDIIETWKEAALDIARDALEYFNHFGRDPASRPDDAVGPLRKAIGKVTALAEAVTKGVQEPDEEGLRDLARKLGAVKKEIMVISRSLVVG
jgi:hypothetical protein